MISLIELLCGVNWDEIPDEHKANLLILLNRLNLIRQAYAKSMSPTNSYRTMAHHLEIYAKKGITDPAKIPVKSSHLFGQAADILDSSGELKTWCKDNQDQLKAIGVWMENFFSTPTWVHFQINPYASYEDGGSLWFNP